jgi:hypothetical protein
VTPEQAQQLAEHASTCWPDVLVSVWTVGLQPHDFAETRAALGRLRVRDVRAVTLEDVKAEIRTGRAPCPQCNGTGWLTEQTTPPVLFDPDRHDQVATDIPEPDVPDNADRVTIARAWAAAIRDRATAPIVTRPRLVNVTSRCPRCNTKEI